MKELFLIAALSLPVSAEDVLMSTNTVIAYSPVIRLTFANGKAWLDWKNGIVTFGGDMDEGAKAFFKFLKPILDDYLKDCREKRDR